MRTIVVSQSFHVMTPYPGTGLFERISAEGRVLHRDWDRYDTRQCVFRPRRMTPTELEEGYWRAYRDFYTWRNILRGASTKPALLPGLRHAAYAAGWKKFERLWNVLIRTRQVACALPVLEAVLTQFGRLTSRSAARTPGRAPRPSLAR